MSSVADGNDLSGITLDGRYALIKQLGDGGMGQVYLAHHGALDREVAVKVLHTWLASERRYRQRFLREARAASRIKHPNVVELLDFGTTPNDSVYLVMELLRGRDLKAVLKEEGPMRWPRARHFLLQAVAALREAHRQDVIHRDIKPANCFVCTPEDPGLPERMKLLDFGIAKLEGEPSASASGLGRRGITQTGELIGTLAYMAPEFAEGRPASALTDMYALGIMAYELLTGKVPFRGRNEFQVLALHLNEPPVRPRVLVPTIPDVVESVVLTLLAKKPEERFASMAALERALLAIPGDVTDDIPVVVPRGPREGSGPKPPIRREGSGPKPAATESREPVEQLVAIGGVTDRSSPDDRWDEVRDMEDEREKPRPPSVEWGTVATVVLLILLSAAGVVSVVLRQPTVVQTPAPRPEPSVSPAPPQPETPTATVVSAG